MTGLIVFELVVGGSESTVCTLRYVTILLTREGVWQPLHMNMMIREQNRSFLSSLPPPFAEQILSELYLQTNKELMNLYILVKVRVRKIERYTVYLFACLI